MSSINIRSDIGKLKSVLVHRPGHETQNYLSGEFAQVFTLRPWSSSFDTDKAQHEHDRFTAMLKAEGVECLYLETLLREALDATPQARPHLIKSFLAESGATGDELQGAMRELLEGASTETLVRLVLDGMRAGEVLPPISAKSSLASATGEAFDEHMFLANPLNTIFFTRDPVTAVGNGVLLNHMYWPERNREVLLYEIIFTYHPRFRDTPKWFKHTSSYHIEGGDVLNLSNDALLVGLSQRTEAAAVDTLARNLLWSESASPITSLYAVEIPSTGTRLHLDTYLNRIDYDAFIVDPHILDTARLYLITKGRRAGEIRVHALDGGLPSMLAQALHLPAVTCINRAGGNSQMKERELENNACAVLCLAPGRLCTFEENVQTNTLLEKAGMELLPLRAEELTAGYGGANCLCLPLWREDLV